MTSLPCAEDIMQIFISTIAGQKRAKWKNLLSQSSSDSPEDVDCSRLLHYLMKLQSMPEIKVPLKSKNVDELHMTPAATCDASRCLISCLESIWRFTMWSEHFSHQVLISTNNFYWSWWADGSHCYQSHQAMCSWWRQVTQQKNTPNWNYMRSV